MNISQLKTFVCVVKHGSISKATEMIYISQSAISQQIKAMEQSFGVRLLDRSHKGVGLTKAGEIVYKHSLTMLNQYQLMMDDLGTAQNISRALRILANPTVNAYALPCVLHDIKSRYPAFSLDIETMGSDDLEEKIHSGLGDIGFIVGKPQHKNLKSKKAFSSEVCLVVEDSGKKIPDQLSIEEIYQYPLLMLSKKQKTQRIVDQYLSKIHIDVDRLTVPYRLDSIESIKVSAIQGYGLAFLPYIAIKKEIYNKQLKIVKIHDFKLIYDYYIIRKSIDDLIDSELLELVSYIEKTLTNTIC